MSDARLLIDTLRLLPAGDVSSMATRWKAADTSAIVRLAEFEGATLWSNRRLESFGISLVGIAHDRLAPAATRAIAKSLRIDAEADEVLAILDEEQVPVVPLKSAVLRRIASRVPQAGARAPNDWTSSCAPAWRSTRGTCSPRMDTHERRQPPRGHVRRADPAECVDALVDILSDHPLSS